MEFPLDTGLPFKQINKSSTPENSIGRTSQNAEQGGREEREKRQPTSSKPGRRPPKRFFNDLSWGWITIIFLLLLIPILIWFYQTTLTPSLQHVAGQIVNHKNFPLENVRVSFLKNIMVTNSNGKFSFTFLKRDSVADITVTHPRYPFAIKKSMPLDGRGPREFVLVFPDLSILAQTSTLTADEVLDQDKNTQTARSVAKGIDRAGYRIWTDLSWQDLLRKRKQSEQDGFRIVDVEVYDNGSTTSYASVWHPITKETRLWKARNWNGLRAKWKEYSQTDLQLIDIESFVEDGENKVIGIWQTGSGGEQRLRVNLNWEEFLKFWGGFARQNFRLLDVESYKIGSQQKYAGVWEAGNDKFRLWKTVDVKEFLEKWEEYALENLHLTDFEIFEEAGQKQYLGIWREATDNEQVWIDERWANFIPKNKLLSQQPHQIQELEIYHDRGANKVSAVWRVDEELYTDFE